MPVVHWVRYKSAEWQACFRLCPSFNITILLTPALGEPAWLPEFILELLQMAQSVKQRGLGN
jgi:hypothetical protein